MMVPPPPTLPPLAPPLSAAQAPQAPQFSLLDTLLPNFNTDTFIWRVSLLQNTEYVGSLLLGSAYGSPKLCSLYLLGASWGPAIAQGAVWRLVLPMMLHAPRAEMLLYVTGRSRRDITYTVLVRNIFI